MPPYDLKKDKLSMRHQVRLLRHYDLVELALQGFPEGVGHPAISRNRQRFCADRSGEFLS